MQMIIKPKKITRVNFSAFGDLISTNNIKPTDINYAEILHPELKVEREEQEQETVKNIKEAVTKNETPDELSKKSKDLFDELFGDK